MVLYALVWAAGASASLLTRTELDLLTAINDARAAYGLKPLRVDPALTRAARAHSLDELRRGYFDHGPFATRLFRFGVRGPYLAENLAWGLGPASAPAAIVRMWLGSPQHRANLLHPGFTRIGLGDLRGPFDGYRNVAMITADFGGTR